MTLGVRKTIVCSALIFHANFLVKSLIFVAFICLKISNFHKNNNALQSRFANSIGTVFERANPNPLIGTIDSCQHLEWTLGWNVNISLTTEFLLIKRRSIFKLVNPLWFDTFILTCKESWNFQVWKTIHKFRMQQRNYPTGSYFQGFCLNQKISFLDSKQNFCETWLLIFQNLPFLLRDFSFCFRKNSS